MCYFFSQTVVADAWLSLQHRIRLVRNITVSLFKQQQQIYVKPKTNRNEKAVADRRRELRTWAV